MTIGRRTPGGARWAAAAPTAASARFSPPPAAVRAAARAAADGRPVRGGPRPDRPDELRCRRELAQAVALLDAHPLFAPLSPGFRVRRERLGRSTWSTVGSDGSIRCDTRLATAEEWAWVIAHQLCHLGMGHLLAGRRVEQDGHIDSRWNAACCVEVDHFLARLGVGRCPLAIDGLPAGDAASLWRRWRDGDQPEADPGRYGVARRGDLVISDRHGYGWGTDWERCFAEGLRAVRHA